MTSSELIEALQKLPPDTEVYCRAGSNDIGSIWNPYAVEKSERAFFGKGIPCVIIEHSLPSMWSGKDNTGTPRARGEILWTEEEEES